MSQLVHNIKNDLNLKIDNVYYWTDSQIVISWIKGDPSTLKTFVANRVARIQELTDPSNWNYINTKENPADLVSQGVFPEQLLLSKLWFEGPSFLKMSQTYWPSVTFKPVKVEDEEKGLKHTTLNASIGSNNHPLYSINHGNSFSKLQRTMAVILRGIKIFKNKASTQQLSPFLTVAELEEALESIIKEIQSISFLDKKGLLRVGGRLENSELNYNAKHPMLLPADSFVSKLLMNHLHITHLHAGPQALHAIARQRFWILQGRNIARSVVANCIQCTRLRPRLCGQQMGNLPSVRVQKTRPFINCGIDFAGPVYTHFKVRGKRPQKTYIALFCCLATKAIHLEIVSDLTTEGFLGALKRFVARRGLCKNIYCDNAKNFVGAKNQLDEVYDMLTNQASKERIANMCTNKNIQFHFIPPRSPHFGGLWEAAVKSTKYFLRRTMASASLTYEELCTVTAEIEALLNSRPLTALSTDPNDLTAITPGHFLIGEPMTASVDTHITDGKMSLLSRWALVSALRQSFWQRWSREYLTDLQKRAKWTTEYPNLKIGTLVLIKDENLPPFKWSMGRVLDTIQGSDGKVRVIILKTATGTLRRAIHQVAPLPVDIPEDNVQDVELSENKEQQVEDNESSTNTNTKRNHENNRMTLRKRKGSPPANPLKVLLMTTLILPLMAHTAPSNSIEIQPFNHSAGIYFERLATASISSSDWHLLAYYDLKGYQATITAIDNTIRQLKKICQLIHHNEYYTEILAHYQHQLLTIRNRNELLLAHKLSESRSRIKRSPFDIVGTIANKFFGVLDNEYGAQITETFNKVKSNEDYLNDLIKNQTLILETTINIIQKSEKERIDQLQEVENGLNSIYDKLRNMSTENKQQKLIQTFNTLSIFITSLLNDCKSMQDSIIDVMLDAHHGKANPLIISPIQLRQQVAIIKENLPAEIMLPSSKQHLEISILYRLMKIYSTVIDNYIVFGIEIPLILSTNFELYKLISFPTLFNNTLVSINTNLQFLMTTIYRDQFYLMDYKEYSQCTHLEENHIICKQRQPIHFKTAANKMCEIELFLQQRILTSCSINFSPMQNRIWIQLVTQNQWLFFLKEKTEVTFICNNQPIKKILQNSGRLIMHDECTMKNDDLIIKSTTNTKSKTVLESFQPKLNLTLNRHVDLNEIHVPSYVQTKLTNHKLEIDKVNNDLLILKEHQKKLQELQPNQIHQLTISYAAFGFVFIIIIYLVIKCYRDRPPKTEMQPEPAPRKRKTKQTDYNFEIKDFKRGQDVNA